MNNFGIDFVVDFYFDYGKYNCLINVGVIVDLRVNIYNLFNWGFENVSFNCFDLGLFCFFFC